MIKRFNLIIEKIVDFFCMMFKIIVIMMKLLKQKEISFISYISTFVILLLAGIFIPDKTSILYLFTMYFLIALILFGFVWDTINVLLKFKNTNFGMLLLFFTSVMLYFTNVQAESIANSLIVSITGEKAQYFPEVASYFESIYMPLAFFFIIMKNVDYFAPIISIIMLISFSSIWIIKTFRIIFIHIFLYFLSMMVLIVIFGSNIDKNYELFFGMNYIPKKIVEYSYHKNTSCENIGDVYINFLDKDRVSVTNIKELKYINNQTNIVFVSNDDKNITFSSQNCIKKKIVSPFKI